jgi:molybdopterin molybdotransferase
VLDLVPPTLDQLGVGRVFHKVAMKPGKPTWFGVRQQEADGHRSLVFGLPGNPVSGLVCFELLVRPALRALGGHGFAEHPRCVASLAEAVAQSADRLTFRPASLQASSTGLSVKAVPWQGSADLASLAAANALIVLSAGEVALAKDEQVEVVVL